MNSSNYEDYMRNVLGYSPIPSNTYANNFNIPYETNIGDNFNLDYRSIDFNSLYPEIYSILKPMVQKACMKNNMQINKETLNQMTQEIYSSIEENQMVRSTSNTEISKKVSEGKSISSSSSSLNSSSLKETRDRNYLMHDLITILILQELRFNGHQFSPPRPSFPSSPVGISPYQPYHR
jgi:hypothetical protein